jgi:hypothetical protein
MSVSRSVGGPPIELIGVCGVTLVAALQRAKTSEQALARIDSEAVIRVALIG